MPNTLFPPLLVKRGPNGLGKCLDASSRPASGCTCAACSWIREVTGWPEVENHTTQTATRKATKRAQQALWNLCVDEELGEGGARVPHVRSTGMRPSSRSWRWSWRPGHSAAPGSAFRPPTESTTRKEDARRGGATNPWPDDSEKGLWWQVQLLRGVVEAMDELDRDQPGRTRGLKALYRIDLDTLQTAAGELERKRRRALSELQSRVRAFLLAEHRLEGFWLERANWRQQTNEATPRRIAPAVRRTTSPLNLDQD